MPTTLHQFPGKLPAITFLLAVGAISSHAGADSNRERAAEILRQLAQPNQRLIIGQNVGHSNGDAEAKYHEYFLRPQRESGRSPALLGLDYGYDDIPPNLTSSSRLVRHFAAEEGLVTISMHPPNPWKRSHVNDTEIGDYDDLTQPGTVAYRRWHVYLDRVARGLAELRDEGIVVMWRPLHEMNGGWFWWCPGEREQQWPTPVQFTRLWRDMHRYFSETKQLDNLLWVYSAAVQVNKYQKAADYYYPGDDVVDVVGLDWYVSDGDHELNRFGSLTQLAAISKPLGLTEYGPQSVRDGSFDATHLLTVANRYPEIRFALFWHSWPKNQMAVADLRNGPKLLESDGVVVRKHRVDE